MHQSCIVCSSNYVPPLEYPQMYHHSGFHNQRLLLKPQLSNGWVNTWNLKRIHEIWTLTAVTNWWLMYRPPLLFLSYWYCPWFIYIENLFHSQERATLSPSKYSPMSAWLTFVSQLLHRISFNLNTFWHHHSCSIWIWVMKYLAVIHSFHFYASLHKSPINMPHIISEWYPFECILSSSHRMLALKINQEAYTDLVLKNVFHWLETAISYHSRQAFTWTTWKQKVCFVILCDYFMC